MQRYYLSVPTKYEIQTFEDDRFLKVKIYVMHDKLNLNGSYFDMTSIESAKSSINNIPILAFVKSTDGTNAKDFGGHESEINLNSNGELEYKYLGRPIGVIPADDNGYCYETFDDKTYVVVYGYIWKDYANEALDIIQECISKGQSMEIRVDEGEWNPVDGNYHIDKYRYTGLCILGDNVTPAMQGAKVKVVESTQFSHDFYEKVEELSNILKNFSTTNNSKKEDEDMPEDIKEPEVIEPIKVEPVTEPEDNPVKPVVEDNPVEPNQEPETKDEPVEPETNTGDGEGEFQQSEDKVFELSTKLTQLQTKYNALEVEMSELRKFKKETINEKELSDKKALFKKFSLCLTEDEMKPLMEKIKEFSLSEIKTKLNEVLCEKTLKNLDGENFSADSAGIIGTPKKEFSTKSRYAV